MGFRRLSSFAALETEGLYRAWGLVALEALLSPKRFTGLRSLNRFTELRELRGLRRLSSFAALETEGFYCGSGSKSLTGRRRLKHFTGCKGFWSLVEFFACGVW